MTYSNLPMYKYPHSIDENSRYSSLLDDLWHRIIRVNSIKHIRQNIVRSKEFELTLIEKRWSFGAICVQMHYFFCSCSANKHDLNLKWGGFLGPTDELGEGRLYDTYFISLLSDKRPFSWLHCNLHDFEKKKIFWSAGWPPRYILFDFKFGMPVVNI